MMDCEQYAARQSVVLFFLLSARVLLIYKGCFLYLPYFGL